MQAMNALPKLGTMGIVFFRGLTTLSFASPASAYSLSHFLFLSLPFPVHTVPASALPAQTNTAQTDVNSHSNSGAVWRAAQMNDRYIPLG